MKFNLSLLFAMAWTTSNAQDIEESNQREKEKQLNAKKCPDLVISDYTWDKCCQLRVAIKNIGWGTAFANQGVMLTPSHVASGDTFEWHTVNLGFQAVGWVNFGVIEATGSTIVAGVDPMNLISECNEGNNKIKIKVPDRCIAEKPRECWDVYLTGPSGLYKLNTETLTTSLITASPWPFEIGFDGNDLWGYYGGELKEIDTSNGTPSSPLTPDPNVNGQGLGSHPSTGELVGGIWGGGSTTLINVDTSGAGMHTGLASIDYSISGDISSYQGTLYISASGSPNTLVSADNTEIGDLQGGGIWGLAEVGVVGGSELWGFNGSGNVYRINISDPSTSTLVGNVGFGVYGAASVRCKEIDTAEPVPVLTTKRSTGGD